MSNSHISIGPKTHPATREILPDDPMEMQAFEVQGDPDLMLRLLVEEYARIGRDTEEILQLARSENYPAFHGLYRLYGETVVRERIAQTLTRCGVTRVRQQEAPPVPENLVQLDLVHYSDPS